MMELQQLPNFSYHRDYRALIQTNQRTGEHRVFFWACINGNRKVVSKNNPRSALKVTGYQDLYAASKNLRNVTVVKRDEYILWDGEPCEHLLFA